MTAACKDHAIKKGTVVIIKSIRGVTLNVEEKRQEDDQICR